VAAGDARDVQNNPISIAANSIICKLNIYPWRESVTSERSRQQSLFSRSLSLLYFSFTGSSAAQQPGPQSARARERERASSGFYFSVRSAKPSIPTAQPTSHPSVRPRPPAAVSIGGGVCCALAFVQLSEILASLSHSLLALLVTQSPRFALKTG
jgi:hypothetical protein